MLGDFSISEQRAGSISVSSPTWDSQLDLPYSWYYTTIAVTTRSDSAVLRCYPLGPALEPGPGTRWTLEAGGKTYPAHGSFAARSFARNAVYSRLEASTAAPALPTILVGNAAAAAAAAEVAALSWPRPAKRVTGRGARSCHGGPLTDAVSLFSAILPHFFLGASVLFPRSARTGPFRV